MYDHQKHDNPQTKKRAALSEHRTASTKIDRAYPMLFLSSAVQHTFVLVDSKNTPGRSCDELSPIPPHIVANVTTPVLQRNRN